ncbi:hypothetical protein [Streptomyces niger]|uniref:hypothetical protein n=1 Tax=Streptomyces niger TaxID=66373 RepID=UPI000699C1AC|nr:hypothetical protein [Streptomyces niger]
MQLTREVVRGWAEAILPQLGPPAGHTLTVTGPGFADEAGETADGRSGPLLAGGPVTGVLVAITFADGSAVGVHVEQPMPPADAIALVADRLQDAVLEETGGAPNPPCPGHRHPAVAEVVAGVACWTCPRGDNAAWPILPAS